MNGVVWRAALVWLSGTLFGCDAQRRDYASNVMKGAPSTEADAAAVLAQTSAPSASEIPAGPSASDTPLTPPGEPSAQVTPVMSASGVASDSVVPSPQDTDVPASGSATDVAVPVPPGCGNGAVDGPESCDDGNLEVADGCDASCQVEAGWTCEVNTTSQCLPICGDGLVVGVDRQAEGCDDGNAAAMDGCDEACTVERGYRCDNTHVPSLCEDLDECAAGAACRPEETCSNTPGGFACSCAVGECQPRSCEGLVLQCGTNADDCCQSMPVAGGSFHEGDLEAPATTVATFAFDKYEVTVGRFRRFVQAYVWPPATGSGAQPAVSGSGWQRAWDSIMASDAESLAAEAQCDVTNQTWRESNENDVLPINCVHWYSAFAFCAWDGGWLPSNAEWFYAAVGGDEQRAYPWGEAEPTAELSVFQCEGCEDVHILPVGSKPLGVGKYGNMDLSGSVMEWTSDVRSAAGVIRGSAWSSTEARLIFSSADRWRLTNRTGFRCARLP